jgi:hypothetical protein
VNATVSRARRASAPLSLRFPPRLTGDLLAVLVSGFVAVEIGAAVVLKPSLAVLPLVALCALVLLVDARARLLFLVLGGLLTLQSSDSLGHVKLAYLAGVFVAFGGALFGISQSKDRFRRALAMPLLRVSLVFFVLVALSLLIARANGIPRTDWLRDVAPYVLFASAPVFALDAQSAFRRRTLVLVLVIAASVATLSFATHWLEQRHIAQLPFSRFALSSFFFPAALFAYAVARALHGNARRARWLMVSALVFALLIVTGTRMTLTLIIAPVVVAIGSRRYFSARLTRLILLGPVVLLVILAAAFSVLTVTHGSTTVISSRLATLKSTGTASDGSYLDRQAQSHAALTIFYANPLFGAGPGTYFNWRATNGAKQSAFIIDSPMDFPAKFGAIGLAAIALLVLNYFSFIRSAFRFNHPRPETLALAGYAALAVAVSFLGNPLEDKGFTLGLLMLLTLVLRTSGGASDGREESARAAAREGA